MQVDGPKGQKVDLKDRSVLPIRTVHFGPYTIVFTVSALDNDLNFPTRKTLSFKQKGNFISMSDGLKPHKD